MSELFDRAKSYITKSMIESMFNSPGAYWKGDEYFTLNPKRMEDTKIGNFSINLITKKYYDFAGDHGDALDLMAHQQSKTPEEIARELTGMTGQRGRPRKPVMDQGEKVEHKKEEKPSEEIDDNVRWRAIEDGERPDFNPEPDYLTLYKDHKTGKGMFYVVRYNLQGGKKEIFPIYKSSAGWLKMLPPELKLKGAKRPLLPIQVGMVVVLVEGERCFHDANSEYPSYSWTTWHGGSKQTPDVASLAGCDVVIWPDNDETGRDCMEKIAERLQGVATRVRVVSIPDTEKKGWDVADAIAEGRDIATLIETSELYKPHSQVEAEGKTTGRPFTDLGNAMRFLDLFKDQVRYNLDRGKWLIWNKTKWDDSDQGPISTMYKQVIKSIMEIGTAAAWVAAKGLQSASAINNMLSLAAREVGVGVREEQLDPDPFYLNCTNGVVDLRTGGIMEHKPGMLLSKCTDIEYKPEAQCPKFLQFLDEIFLGRAEVIDMMQRWFGYSATADMSAQTFMILYGAGANGKSTLVELVAKVLGGYAKPAPPDSFIQKQSSGIPNDVAAMRGARMVLTTETESNAKLAESKVKSITGGDRVSARFMRGEFFEFSPTWKIIISTNHRPRIQGSDYGIWRRIALVPFEFTASGDKLDPLLPRKLWEEREGILSWIVEGAKRWYTDGEGRKGLNIAESVATETQNYREDEDLIARFIDQGCVKPGDSGWIDTFARIGMIESRILYQAFVRWAEADGEKWAAQTTHTAFGRAMGDRGYRSVRGRSGRKGYEGIFPIDYKISDGGF